MFSSDLVSAMTPLVKSGFLVGIKVETESEGMSHQGVARLQVLASAVGCPLILKIGGCEALSDLNYARDLGVAEIVAPMIESSFAVHKFKSALDTVYPSGFEPKARILVESEMGYLNLESVLKMGTSFAVGLNVGRSDLSASFGIRDSKKYAVDDAIVLEATAEIIRVGKTSGFEITVGGKVTPKSIEKMAILPNRFETRRFVFDAKMFSTKPELFTALSEIELSIAEAFAWTALRDSQTLHASVEELKSRFMSAKQTTELL